MALDYANRGFHIESVMGAAPTKGLPLPTRATGALMILGGRLTMANDTTLRLTLAGPPEAIAAFKAAHIVENTNSGYDGSHIRLSFETFAPYQESNGREWAYENWGSCYNAGYFRFIRDEPSLIECRFCAYNGHAEPIFAAIASRFPDLTGTVEGEEDGGFYCCTGSITDGLYKVELFEWSEEHYAVVHGEPYERVSEDEDAR